MCEIIIISILQGEGKLCELKATHTIMTSIIKYLFIYSLFNRFASAQCSSAYLIIYSFANSIAKNTTDDQITSEPITHLQYDYSVLCYCCCWSN